MKVFWVHVCNFLKRQNTVCIGINGLFLSPDYEHLFWQSCLMQIQIQSNNRYVLSKDHVEIQQAITPERFHST